MLWLIEVCRRLVVGSCCAARPVERGLDLLPGARPWQVIAESKVPVHHELWRCCIDRQRPPNPVPLGPSRNLRGRAAVSPITLCR
jgi:hypothetical protein